MIEIKFLKDLPIKLTNTNKSVLTVLGGDIYYDSDGNRFGFISFKNTNKSPIYAMQLAIREYSVDGKFIRDNELFEAYTYYPTGDFVINQPILLDKEAEAIEVTIVKLTFRKMNFVNDRFVAFKKEDYINLYQTKAPVKRNANQGNLFFQGVIPQQQASVADNKEKPQEKADEKPVVNEEIKEMVKDAASEAAPQAAPSVPPVNETPVAELNNFAQAKKTFFASIPFMAAFLVIIIFIFVIMSSVAGGVNMFNQWYLSHH